MNTSECWGPTGQAPPHPTPLMHLLPLGKRGIPTGYTGRPSCHLPAARMGDFPSRPRPSSQASAGKAALSARARVFSHRHGPARGGTLAGKAALSARVRDSPVSAVRGRRVSLKKARRAVKSRFSIVPDEDAIVHFHNRTHAKIPDKKRRQGVPRRFGRGA